MLFFLYGQYTSLRVILVFILKLQLRCLGFFSEFIETRNFLWEAELKEVTDIFRNMPEWTEYYILDSSKLKIFSCREAFGFLPFLLSHLSSFPAFPMTSFTLFVLGFHFYLLLCLYFILVICIFLPLYVPSSLSLSIVFRSIGKLINCTDLEMYSTCVLRKRKEKTPQIYAFYYFKIICLYVYV